MNTEKQILKETYDRMLDSQWAKDFDKPMNINGRMRTKAEYNLAVCIRDVSLFTKGLKPYRDWIDKNGKNHYLWTKYPRFNKDGDIDDLQMNLENKENQINTYRHICDKYPELLTKKK